MANRDAGRRGRRLVGVLIAVLALGLVAGCVRVPESGSVRSGGGGHAGAGLDEPGVRLLAPPPQPNTTPDELLRGLLSAMGDPESRFAAAREYLTQSANLTWDPYAGTVVLDPGTLQVVVQGSTVVVRANQVAEIGRDRGYRVVTGPFERRFVTAKTAAGLRFQQVPPGLLLTATDVRRSDKAVDLFFTDPSLFLMVPDRVYLPVGRSELLQALVERLLAGPTRWLAPAVKTAIPAGTRLQSPVSAAGGIVTVNLTGRLPSDSKSRAALAAQVVWTVTQLPEVAGVRVRVGGQDALAGRDVLGREDVAAFDPDQLPASVTGYYVSGDRLVRLDGSAVPLGGPGPNLTQPTVALSAPLVAAVHRTAAATTLYQGRLGDTSMRAVTTAARMSPPVWGPGLATWVAIGTAGGPLDRVVAVAPSAASSASPLVAAVPQMPTLGTVSALAFPRDGTRVAVVAGVGAAAAVSIGRVIQSGRTWVLDGFRPVASGLGTALDVGWADSNTLLVLAKGPVAGGQPAPWLVPMGGVDPPQPVTTSGLPVPTSLAGAPGRPTLAAAGSRVWRLDGGLWAPIAAGTDPTYPS